MLTLINNFYSLYLIHYSCLIHDIPAVLNTVPLFSVQILNRLILNPTHLVLHNRKMLHKERRFYNQSQHVNAGFMISPPFLSVMHEPCRNSSTQVLLEKTLRKMVPHICISYLKALDKHHFLYISKMIISHSQCCMTSRQWADNSFWHHPHL